MSNDSSDWYWFGTPGLYGSKRAGLVEGDPSKDAEHAAWLSRGLLPTPWPRNASGTQTTTALDEVLAAAGQPATGLSITTQKASLVGAAADALANLSVQIMPTEALQTVYLSLVSIVTASGDGPPAGGSLLTKFSALASAYGLSPSDLAAVVVALRNAIIGGATAEVVLQTAVTAATQASDLIAAKAAFESALAAVVTEANSVLLPSPVIAPPAIVISGL